MDEVPLRQPTPSYPANYAQPQTPTSSSTPQESPSNPPSRKNSSHLSLPGLGNTRNTSFLSLASLNLANSSSSLLGIFSSALDSVPPTPVATPPIESRRERPVIEEIDTWAFIRDTLRSASVLFVVGYAFALLLLSLEKNHALPFPYFQAMTELTHFPLFSGATTVLMGCSIPIADYYYSKHIEETQWRTQSRNHEESRPLWERAEWSMPMRYLGGVVGFAWAASRLNWTSQVQLYAVIALAALALWYLFDQTGLGMLVSLVVGIGSWLGFILIITPGMSQQAIDATGWMPSALFSANVAFGNIGRKLFEREGHVVRRRYTSVNRRQSFH